MKKLTLDRANKRDALGIFLLGFTFSFGWTLCIRLVLVAILGLSAGSGTVVYVEFLMAVYSLGFAIPSLVLSIFSGLLLSKINALKQQLNTIKTISGVIIILMGILLMTNNLNTLTAWIGDF